MYLISASLPRQPRSASAVEGYQRVKEGEYSLLVPWLIVQPSYLFKISLDRLNYRVDYVRRLGSSDFPCSESEASSM